MTRRTYLDPSGVVVETDGQTVWVNAPTKCIGRFSGQVAEVFDTSIDTSGQTNVEVYSYGHDAEMWERFCAAMKYVHFVEIPEDMRPKE